MTKSLLPLLSGLLFATALTARDTYPLNEGWRSVCYPEGGADSLEIFRQTLPHNWDDYYGYRQYTHGNLHGTARYERHFTLSALTHQTDAAKAAQQLYTLRLEGAGSYVSVWVNGKEICTHRPAGRVVTSLNITEALHLENPSAQNNLVILCEHPSNITDLPWVCGGCSSEWGFSEGSAPFGLFRSVSLEVTDPLRVEPFGVHAWANEALDTVWVETEIRNYSNYGQSALIQTVIAGRLRREPVQLGAHLSATVRQAIPMEEVKLQPWSPAQPQLYTVTTTLMHGTQHEVADKVQTTVGFNSIKWPSRTADGRLADIDHRFYVNGEPTYLHGVCEYEHLFGQSHALTDEEIDYRCNLIHHLGFNAVRDAHQPHHLRYGENYAQQGVLWWPQFSAHIWYDTPQFRENFKIALPATIVSLVIIILVSLRTDVSTIPTGSHDLLLLIPYVLVLIGGIAGLNVFVVLLIGIASGAVITLATGQMTALEVLSGMGSGVSGMFETILVTILVSALCGMIRTHAEELGVEVKIFQSNHEGALVDVDVAVVVGVKQTPHFAVAVVLALLYHRVVLGKSTDVGTWRKQVLYFVVQYPRVANKQRRHADKL